MSVALGDDIGAYVYIWARRSRSASSPRGGPGAGAFGGFRAGEPQASPPGPTAHGAPVRPQKPAQNDPQRPAEEAEADTAADRQRPTKGTRSGRRDGSGAGIMAGVVRQNAGTHGLQVPRKAGPGSNARLDRPGATHDVDDATRPRQPSQTDPHPNSANPKHTQVAGCANATFLPSAARPCGLAAQSRRHACINDVRGASVVRFWAGHLDASCVSALESRKAVGERVENLQLEQR